MYGKSVLFSCRVVSTSHSIRYISSNSTKKLLEFLAEMPKANSTRIAEAQRQRQHIAKKSEKYGPSTVYLQVLGSGARGAPNTLYLFTDQKRYLFNCGECTQRLAHEHKVKLSRLDHIFITSKTWRNIGGLPGLSLTLQDVGVPNITLHGPEGLDELYNATRRFVIMKDMHVTMANCSPSEDFEDSTMNVKYVLLGPHDNLLDGKELKQATKKQKLESNFEKEFEEFIHDETDYYNKQEVHPVDSKFSKISKPKVKPTLDKASDPQKKKTEKVLHDLQRKTHCTVAYICTLKKRLGTLDLAKCVELGVKPGPMLGQLKAGHDVVLHGGTLVLSKDVKTPDDPGPVFIVLDVPELSYLKDSEFSAHFDNGTNPPENIPALIVHITPPEVFHHPSYRSFMLNFGPTTRHLVLNSQNSCLGSEAVHRTQHKLHLLDPDIFPLLRDASLPAVWNTHPVLPKSSSPIRIKGLEELKNKIALAQFQNIINMEGSCRGDDGGQNHGPALEDEQNKLEIVAGRTLTTFHLRPKKQLDRSTEPKLHIQDYIQETMDVDGFAGSLDHFRRQVEGIRYSKADCKEFPKVVFLGTGSCIPSKTRNTSAIVLHIDDNRSILMDCGEGTYGQLVRFYGPKRVNTFLRTLKAIYVSHLHADHHIGLIGVLQARRKAWLETDPECTPDPLYLLAPGQIYTWLSLYDLQFEKIRGDFALVPNQSLLYDASKNHNEMTSAVLANIGVRQIQTCLVSHCPNAFGVAIQVNHQYKITYSGDTIPCEELVKIGENSTILIHEATMEDDLAEEARMKMHSTTSQAIDMGKLMRARYTVLTHFSQRYARLPRLSPHILNDNHSVGIAFDNMQITMSDLALLPHMYAPLQLMFAEHCVEMELKAASRTRKKERRASFPHLSPDKSGRPDSWARSPVGCSSSPPKANYRESNASRLRQESRGMTVTGIVRRNSSSRSNSASPSKQRLQTARPKPSEDVAVKPTGACPAMRLPPSESETSDRDLERDSSVLATASTGYVLDTRSKTINNIPSRIPTSEECLYRKRKSHTITLANLVQSLGPGTGSGYGKPLVTSLNKKLTIMRQLPVNLCEMKDTSPGVGRGKSPNRIWRNENKETISKRVLESIKSKSLKNARLEVVTSILVHLLFWRLAHIATYLCPMHWIVLFAIIAVGIFIWTADKGAMGTLQTSNTVSKLKPPPDKLAMVKNAVASKQKEIRVQSATYTKKIPCKQSPTRSEKMEKNDFDLYTNIKQVNQPSRDKTPPVKKSAPDFDLYTNIKPVNQSSRDKTPPVKKSSPATGKAEKKDVPGVKTPRSNSRSRSPSADGKREKPLSEPYRQVINERVKIQHNRDNAVVGRPSASMYSRSFKPQLEDIKSSFMLLNKTNKDHKRSTNEREKKDIVKVHKPKDFNEENCKPKEFNEENRKRKEFNEENRKPKEFNEEYRKRQLQQAKNKFQSKHFFHDQKYDKIEGLNWITWN